MVGLKGYRKRFLKGLAHRLKPVVFIGQKGLTRTLVDPLLISFGFRPVYKQRIYHAIPTMFCNTAG